MSRFLCVGDLHLDKGGRYGRAPGERLAEQETVWAWALELAREHSVDAVLFAGDAFEKRHPSTDAMLAFERPLLEHRAADGPPVIAIPGNHDRSGVSEWCALDVFGEAGLIDLYSRPTVPSVAISVDDDCAIACLPWAPVSRIVAAHDGALDRDDVNAVAAELLVETARDLRQQIPADWPCVLLTHFSISGAVTPDGVDVGLFREPVLDLADLEELGFDAVIAGHIHRPQLLTSPAMAEIGPVFYTGSPMPLDFGEAKCDHGVYLLDINEQIRPRPIHVDFLPIEGRRFLTMAADITDRVGDGLPWLWPDDLQAIEGSFVKARITLTAEQARNLDTGRVRDGLFEAGAHNVWVELNVQRELRARVDGIDETVSDIDALELWLATQSVNGDQAPALRELHTDYCQEVR